jgi:hypothetical protein
VNVKIYKSQKSIIEDFQFTGDPCLLLRSILPRESMLLDPAMQAHVRFRLGGARFPPMIYFKIFTHGSITDIGAFAPRNYAAERMGKPRREEDRYLRQENNGWRPLVSRAMSDAVEKASSATCIKRYQPCRMQRKQDRELARRRRRSDWIRKLAPSVSAGAPGGISGIARKARAAGTGIPTGVAQPHQTSDRSSALADDDLVLWSQQLEFDAYMESWTHIATSDVSEGTLPIASCSHPFIALVHG